jgi:hypothetical protein
MESSPIISYIEELESQIALLDEATAALQLRRADLLQSVKFHKSFLSPVRRLPPEILGEIFSLVVHAGFPDDRDLPVTQYAPWLFTRVCRHWSAVALANPSLWSMIYLNLDDRRGELGAVSLTKLRLQRSGNLPLTIRIVQDAGDDSFHPVLDVVLASSERWRTADLNFSYPLLPQITRIRGHLSSLTTLLVSMEACQDVPAGDLAFRNVFAVAPQLRSLHGIWWYGGDFISAPFSLPWRQLTRMHITFATNTEALPALRELSDLVECHLAFDRIEILPMDHSTIHLPHLRSLMLQIDRDFPRDPATYEKHTSLLDFLDTPCLRSLTTDQTADEEEILALIARSDCAVSLMSFHFHSSWIHQDNILHLVQKMPHLTSLTVSDFDGSLHPWSSVPTIIQALSTQWLGAAQEALPRQARRSLRVQIVDQALDPKDADDITHILAPMHTDGLFMTVSSQLNLRDIWDKFDY